MIAVHCRYAYVQAAYSAQLLLLCALLSLTMSVVAVTVVVLICRAIYTPSRLFISYHDSITYAPIALQQAVPTVVMPAAASQLLLLTKSLLITLVGLVLAIV
jgi:hypothetical protein